MSGLFRTLIFCDLGNWHHTQEVENAADTNAFRIRVKEKLDNEQTLSIMELELVIAGVVTKLMEKGLLSENEVTEIITKAEEESDQTLKNKHRLINPSLIKK